MTQLDRFTAILAKAVRHTPYGVLNRRDLVGLRRIAERMGFSEAQFAEIVTPLSLRGAV